MKIHFTFFGLVLSFLVTGCSMTTVTYDYDKDFNFSTLKTFAWLEVTEDLPVNEIIVRRIKKAVNEQLNIKGFQPSEALPDFYISLQGFVDIIQEGVERGVAYRGYRGYDRTYERRAEIYEYREGTITLTMINAQSNTLIWQGSATRPLTTNPSVETREKNTTEIVSKLLAEFPPTSDKG